MADSQLVRRKAFEQFKKFKNEIKDKNQSKLTECFVDKILKTILALPTFWGHRVQFV